MPMKKFLSHGQIDVSFGQNGTTELQTYVSTAGRTSLFRPSTTPISICDLTNRYYVLSQIVANIQEPNSKRGICFSRFGLNGSSDTSYQENGTFYHTPILQIEGRRPSFNYEGLGMEVFWSNNEKNIVWLYDIVHASPGLIFEQQSKILEARLVDSPSEPKWSTEIKWPLPSENGEFNQSFSPHGACSLLDAHSVLVAGSNSNGFWLAKYAIDTGEQDLNFGGGTTQHSWIPAGFVNIEEVGENLKIQSLAVDIKKNIYILGTRKREGMLELIVVKLDRFGRRVPEFATSGIFIQRKNYNAFHPLKMRIQKDEKIVISTKGWIEKISKSGQVIQQFGRSGAIQLTEQYSIQDIAISDRGYVLCTGIVEEYGIKEVFVRCYTDRGILLSYFGNQGEFRTERLSNATLIRFHAKRSDRILVGGHRSYGAPLISEYRLGLLSLTFKHLPWYLGIFYRLFRY